MYLSTVEERKAHIAALLRERELHINDLQRVAEINEQLRIFGHEAAPPQKRSEKRLAIP